MSESSKSEELIPCFTVDVLAACGASFCVSPFISIVDRSIIENASGKRKLKEALSEISRDFLRNPFKFVRRKEFLLIFGLYSATYVTANTIDTIMDYQQSEAQLPKFVGTTAVNMSLCVAKDREFARMFGVIAPTKMPLASLGLFAIRDSLTVAASFTFPKIITPKITEHGFSISSSEKIAQLCSPAAIQFISTPLHLLGLDLYNNRQSTPKQRFSFVAREYLKSSFARIARIGPAFGIGGIGNKFFRDSLRDTFSV